MGSLGAMQQELEDRCSRTRREDARREAGAGRHRGPGSVQGRLAAVHPPAHGRRARCDEGYCGCPTIEALAHAPEFIEISAAGMRESHVHDVQITKEARTIVPSERHPLASTPVECRA